MTNHSKFFESINKQLDDNSTLTFLKTLSENKRIYKALKNGYDNFSNSKPRTKPNYEMRNKFLDMCCNTWRDSLITTFDKFFEEAKTNPVILNKFFGSILSYHTTNELIKSFKDLKEIQNFSNETYDELNTFHPNSINNLLVRFLDWKKQSDNSTMKCSSNLIKLNTSSQNSIEHKLFVQCEICNIDELAFEFAEKCFNDKKPFYFTYSLNKDKSDAFVVYSNSYNLGYFIDTLKVICKAKPYLFDSQSEPFLLTGKVFNGVYYGSEPFNAKDDFNGLREEAIVKAIVNEILNFSTTFLNEDLLDNATTEILNSFNKSYSLEEFNERKNLVYQQLIESFTTDYENTKEINDINCKIREILFDILEDPDETFKEQTIKTFNQSIKKEFDVLGISPDNVCFNKTCENNLKKIEEQDTIQ